MEDQDNEPTEFPEQEQDPVSVEEMEDRVDEGIRSKIRARFHFADDEMTTLFPDRKALRDFYQDSIKIRKVKEPAYEKIDDGDSEKEPEDTYELPSGQKREIVRRLKKRKGARKKLEKGLEKKGEKMLENISSDEVVTAEESEESEENHGPKEIDTARPPKSLKELLGDDFDL
jgi:hypothetical protein